MPIQSLGLVMKFGDLVRIQFANKVTNEAKRLNKKICRPLQPPKVPLWVVPFALPLLLLESAYSFIPSGSSDAHI
jgi:hypothetical protein